MTHGQQPLLERAGDGERRGAPVPRPEAAGATPPPGADGRWRRHRRWLYGLAVVVLLGQMAVAMVTAAVRQTPTIDEPVYVATAVVQTQQHSLRYNPEHPPLGKLLIAAGTVFAEPRLDPGFDGDQTELGRELLYGSGNDPERLMRAARLPVIVSTLLFGLVVLAFARELAGPAGGLVALALYAFSPDVIAHGSLATLDVPAAGFLLTSAWLLWRSRLRPRLFLPLAGAALGAALATKMSTLAAVPVLLVAAVLSVWRAAGHPSRAGAGTGPRPAAGVRAGTRRGLVAVAVVGLAAVAVVWLCYLAVDPRLRWAPPPGVPPVRGLRGLAVGLLPFPAPYRDGMLIQFGFEERPWRGFLFGRLYQGSLWYYLPAALLVKTPLGTLALWAAGAVATLRHGRLRRAAPYVLVPAVVLLAAAMTGDRDLGVRYAVFLPMFLAVAAGGVVTVRRGGRRAARAVTAALLLCVAVSSLRAYPYYLPYSNEAFGGPAKTHHHLHDSNVDWGQDLGRLADRLRERHAHERRIWLVYKGSGVPRHYGIRASDPREVPLSEVRGLIAVSNSAAAKARGRLAALLADSRPVGEVGHSITLYRRAEPSPPSVPSAPSPSPSPFPYAFPSAASSAEGARSGS